MNRKDKFKQVDLYTEIKIQKSLNILEKIITIDNVTLISENLKNNEDNLHFHKYYEKILKNYEDFLNIENFFSTFKYMYSIQGVDIPYIQFLESNKKDILKKIKDDDPVSLYVNYFQKRNIKYLDKSRVKDFPSFFSKLLHTFLPEFYPALDNPIKNLLDFKNEGFLYSYLCITELYKDFITNYPSLLNEIRSIFNKSSNIIDYSIYSDIKYLDLILWNTANLTKESDVA